MIEDIIAAAIADGAPEAGAMSAAIRVKAALIEAGVSLDVSEPYQPKPYPKWVGRHLVKNAKEEAALTAKPIAPVAPEVVESFHLPAEPLQSVAEHEPEPEPSHEPPAEPPHTA